MIKEMFVYDWVLDSNKDTTHIRMYGISPNEDGTNNNICLRIENFKPYAYIQLPTASDNFVRALIDSLGRLEVPPIRIELFKKYHLYNFDNHQSRKSPFMFVNFHSKKQIQDMVYHLKRGIKILGETVKLKVHETSASPILQMVSLRDIPMSGWIDFSQGCPESLPECEKMTACDEEYIIKWKNLNRSKRAEQVIPKCMAFDMEVNSEYVNQMPSNRPNDIIFQISCVITEQNRDRRKILLSLKANDMNLENSELLKDMDVQVFDNEIDLLQGFINLTVVEKPNVLTGFNIFGFDIEYAMKRCGRFFLSDELKFAGFNKQIPATIEEINWSSSAYKNQVFKFIKWEGILLLDLLPIIRRDYKLDTYTLKNVTATFLNNNTKDPVTYKDIFTACRTREKLDVVGKYCVQDSDLCIELMNHLHTWVALSEMAKVCNVSMFTLYTQGQQIKLYSQVFKYCLRQNIVVDTDGYEAKSNERYRGAHVIEPIPGFYKRVVPVDFSSLYPSLIIAYNICYSTITDERTPDDQCNIFKWEDHIGCEHDPREIKIKELTEKIDKIGEVITTLRTKRNSVNATTVPKGTTVKNEKLKYQAKIDEKVKQQKPFREKRQELTKTRLADQEDEEGNKVSRVVCAKRYYRFLKPDVKKGVIPIIIQSLLDSRKRVKGLMKKCDDKAQKIVYDKEQLAYKVSANSMYGAMGVKRGYLPFMPGAMCVTYAGRTSLEKTAKLIQEHFRGILIYGDTDSCYVKFNHIDSITETWDYAIKVADEVTNWTENGKRVFPVPIKLEFENTIYERFLILSKKRYMYQEIDRDGNFNKKVGKKGVILARRDNSQLVRSIYEKVTSMIFDGVSKEDLYQYVDEYIGKIYDNKIEYKDYVITKSVGDSEGTVDDSGRMGDYKIRKVLPQNDKEKEKLLNGKSEKDYYISCCPAQVQLAERMKKRGVPVDAGSRIEYVVTKKPYGDSLGEKIEDYEYFKRYSSILKIDFKYYVEKQMINPLDQIFKTMGYGEMTKDLSNKWDEIYKKRIAANRPKFIYKSN
jgi:DNA polymerase elongation subunit (family B)